jgi:uncharacterized membrane protein required for colicin V production
MGNNRGQLDLSFGLIFSVILIIAFLGFAIYALVSFLGMKEDLKTSVFLEDLQTDVDKFWKSDGSSDEISYSLPTKVKKVCFINSTYPGRGSDKNIYEELKSYLKQDANLIFYPIRSASVTSIKINHLDILNITKTNNPACFDNKAGKTILNLKQDLGGTNLVMIE